jgi:hypothetical protein
MLKIKYENQIKAIHINLRDVMTKLKVPIEELLEHDKFIAKKTFNFFKKIFMKEVSIINSNYIIDLEDWVVLHENAILMLNGAIFGTFVECIKAHGAKLNYEQFIKDHLDKTKLYMEHITKGINNDD